MMRSTHLAQCKAQIALIQDLQHDEWWQDVTTPMLEQVRKKLRALVKLIDKLRRKPIYTDFEDTMGEETEVKMTLYRAMDSFERFRAKARAYLMEHEQHIAIHKVRMNKPLTHTDLDELEKMLIAVGAGSAEHLQKAKEENKGLGLFVRSLVGLDRAAAKEAFAGFLTGKTLRANQIDFVNRIVDHLTERGVMDPSLLYESPFTDVAPQGPETLFAPEEVKQIVAVLRQVQAAAQVA